MNYLNITRKISCSLEDKREAIELIDKICCQFIHYKKNGWLSTEEGFGSIYPPFSRKAIELSLDTIRGELMKEILLNYLNVGKYSSKEFLFRILIIEGLYCMTEDIPIWITIEKLLSFLGEDFTAEANKFKFTYKDMISKGYDLVF